MRRLRLERPGLLPLLRLGRLGRRVRRSRQRRSARGLGPLRFAEGLTSKPREVPVALVAGTLACFGSVN